MDTYVEYMKQNRMVIPIYSIGVAFADSYMERDASVKEFRMAFEEVDSLLQQFLLKVIAKDFNLLDVNTLVVCKILFIHRSMIHYPFIKTLF